MKKRFKYRFYPTELQKQMFIKTFGASRHAYNWCLNLRSTAYTIDKIKISYVQMDKAFNQYKQKLGNEWLLEVSSVPLQQSIRHLQIAYDKFFKKLSKYPTFKSKKDHLQSMEYTLRGFSFRKKGRDKGKLFIAKSKEPLDIRWSRSLPSVPTSLTIKRDSANRWFVSFVVDVPKIKNLKKTIPVKGVGIDLGIETLATLSDGSVYKNQKHFDKYYSKLKKTQKVLSRKTLGSKNRTKARLKVAGIHAKIGDARLDQINKFTTKLANENQVIAIEDLAVQTMIRDHKFAKALNDASFGMIRSQLEYKTQERGTDLVIVNRFFPSSKLCSNCGAMHRDLKLSDRIYKCACGLKINRDYNASINILAAGLADRLNDCGDGRRPEGSTILEASVYETVRSQMQI